MKFLRNLFASFFGTLIAIGFLIALLILIGSAFGETKKVEVKNNAVLTINLKDVIKDYAPKSENPLDDLLNIKEQTLGLNNILNAIENAAFDNRIKGISISTLGVNAGIAQIQAIRNKLLAFKDYGKFIYAYADGYDQKAYYLSSVADSVFLNPRGMVNFKGLATEIVYFKDFENKFGVKYEVIRHGKYKSAVEPFLTNKMSENNRKQITSFLKSIWNELLLDISKSRNITTDKLNSIADNLLGRNAVLANKNKLIDGIIYIDEYENKLKNRLEISLKEPLNTVSLTDYIASGKGRIRSSASDKIAIIYAQGEIIYGKGDENHIGQDLIINALQKARETNNTKAIVLRVNSPGGSALASDLIWREIELTKKQIPVVVSMGNVAASGGYYISCNANKIIAEPTTITGSIGVFGMLPNFSELSNKLGINAEQVKTNTSASYSIFEPISNDFKAVTKEGVEAVYTTFLQRVATGRNLNVKTVDSIAQGRVWTGVQAVENGLVDQLGNLHDAVIEAAGLAGITDYAIRNYPNYQIDFQDKLSKLPFIKSKEKILLEEFGQGNYKIYKDLKTIFNAKGIQARLPFVITIN
jgi:protease-4